MKMAGIWFQQPLRLMPLKSWGRSRASKVVRQFQQPLRLMPLKSHPETATYKCIEVSTAFAANASEMARRHPTVDLQYCFNSLCG